MTHNFMKLVMFYGGSLLKSDIILVNNTLSEINENDLIWVKK